MANETNKNLKVGVGFSVTDTEGGLQKLAENITKINSGGKNLATTMSEVEKAVKKVLEAQGKLGENDGIKKQQESTKDTLTELQRIQKQYNTNLVDAKKYYEELIRLEQQYRDKLNSSTQGSKEYDQSLKALQEVVKAKNALNKEAANEEIKQEKALTELIQQENKIRESEEKAVKAQEVKDAKDAANQQKQIAKELTAYYKQAATERQEAFAKVNEVFNGTKTSGVKDRLTAMIGYSAISSVTSELQNLGSAISDINYNTINNQRLMGDMSKQLRDELNSNAAEIARSTGTLITDAQEIQGAWIRINDEYAKSPKLLNEMSKLTAEFMNVGEVKDAEDAVALVNASMLQLGISAKDSTEKIANAKDMLNKWSYMADKTAMGTADEYGEAISKFGSAITTLGGDLDDAMVLTSTAADYLAKNGAEAGNSLKTFVQYLNRPKTVTLFNEISKDLNDTKYKLVDTKGEFKSFAEIMNAASDAYNKYMKMGDQQQARKIVEALGATRQSDVSTTILKNWKDEASSYYDMLDEVAEKGNYLEQQNDKLMSSMKNQFNSLVVSLQQVGMAFANSGIIAGLTSFMKVGTSALTLISKIPSPILAAVTALASFKAGIQGINKLGDVTGIADKLWKSMYSGTQAQIENALATQESTEQYVKQQEIIFETATAIDKSTTSYSAQLQVFREYQLELANNAKAFSEGRINAVEYEQTLESLKAEYQANTAAVVENAQGEKEKAAASRVANQSLKEETTLENANTGAKTRKLTTLLKEKALVTANNGLRKIGITTTIQETVADKESTVSKIANTSSLVANKVATVALNVVRKLSLGLLSQETVAHGASTVAKGAETAATTVLTGAMTALGVAIQLVNPPMLIATVAIGALTSMFSNSKTKTDQYKSSIDDLTNSVNESKQRIQELQEQQNNGKITEGEKEELKNLKEEVELEEKALKLKRQQKNNKEYKNEKSKEIDKTLKSYKEAKNAVETFSKAIKGGSASERELEMWNKQLAASNKKVSSTSADVVTQYNYLQKGIREGKWSGEMLEKAKSQMASLKKVYEEAGKQVESDSKKISDSTDSINDVDFSKSEEQIKNFTNTLKQSSDDIETLLKGEATSEDLIRMAESYEGFAKVIGKSTEEQITYIRNFRKNAAKEEFEEIDKQIDTAQQMYDKAYKALQDLDKKGVKTSSEDYKKALQEYQDCVDKLQELQSMKDYRLNIEVDVNGVENAKQQLSGISSKVEALNTLFTEYNKNGYLSGETIQSTLNAHEDFVKYLVKEGDQYKLNTLAVEDLKNMKKEEANTTQQLVEGLKNEQNRMNNMSADMKKYMQDANSYTSAITASFQNVKGLDELGQKIMTINSDFAKGKTSATEFSDSLNELINKNNFSVLQDNINNTSDYIKNLDQDTQDTLHSQQALFSSLTSEIAGYEQDLVESLQNGTIGVSEYMSSLEASNSTLLQLYTTANSLTQDQSGKWVDMAGEVDEYANSLQDALDTMQGMPEVAQYITDSYDQMSLAAEKNAIVTENCENAKTAMAWWSSNEGTNAAMNMYDNFASVMGSLNQTNYSAWQSVVDQTVSATGLSEDKVISALTNNAENSQQAAMVVGAGTSAMMNLVGNAAQTTTNAAANVFTALGNMIKKFDYTITFGVTGGISPGGNILDLITGKSFTPKSDLKLKVKGSGGSSVKSLASSLSNFGKSLSNLALSQYLNNIKSYSPKRSSSSSAPKVSGGSYKPAPVTSSSGSHSSGSGHSGSGSSGSGNKGSSSKGSGSSGKTQAEKDAEAAKKAAEEAAKASKEAAETIQKLTEEYTQNVESMYDRIAKALKQKYEDEYEERKKLLEKEHNERVNQIQAEIDALNGDRPEDKNKQLENLKTQLEKWKKDDSSLGKSKQKEYMDKISDLEKEIKLDELQAKLDKENEDFDNATNKESEYYDAVLKKLDEQMTDQMLYAEARDMIVEGKQQEIIDLLTKYDSNWSGWATLMGQTAGDVIAKEVRLALANYLDVTKGTIGTNGGYYTNKVNSGSSTSSSSSGGSSSGSSGSSSGGSSSNVTKGWKVRINDTSARMYYTSTSKSAVGNWRRYTGTYYVVNDKAGRVALAKSNSVRAAIGWIDKNKVVGASTGTYTGNQEGLALLHKKERVLSAAQTKAFDNLVYSYLPKLEKQYTTIGDTENKTVNSNQFNAPLTQINVDKVINNTPSDVRNTEDNLARAVKKSLAKSGIKPKR